MRLFFVLILFLSQVAQADVLPTIGGRYQWNQKFPMALAISTKFVRGTGPNADDKIRSLKADGYRCSKSSNVETICRRHTPNSSIPIELHARWAQRLNQVQLETLGAAKGSTLVHDSDSYRDYLVDQALRFNEIQYSDYTVRFLTNVVQILAGTPGRADDFNFVYDGGALLYWNAIAQNHRDGMTQYQAFFTFEVR